MTTTLEQEKAPIAEQEEAPETPEALQISYDAQKKACTIDLQRGSDGIKERSAQLATTTAIEPDEMNQLKNIYADAEKIPRVFEKRATGIEAGESSQETKEEEKSAMKLVADQFVKEARALLDEQFSKAEKNSPQNLDFHNAEHTNTVIDRTAKILTAMKNGGEDVTDEDIAIGKIVAAAHDLIQRSNVSEAMDKGAPLPEKRKRFIRANERASIDEGKKMLRTIEAFKILTPEKQEKVNKALEAIMVTVPDGWDGKTVVQNGLTKNSPPIERALALADLGDAGMDTDSYTEAGKRLFREENIDMLDVVNRFKKGETISEEDQKKYKDRMVEWSKAQVGFAKGRSGKFSQEIEGLSDDAKKNVTALFEKFRTSIEEAENIAGKREGMHFANLLFDMGYLTEEERLVAPAEKIAA